MNLSTINTMKLGDNDTQLPTMDWTKRAPKNIFFLPYLSERKPNSSAPNMTPTLKTV